MDKASEAILALKPVIFRYKKEIEPNAAIMFGLIAEDVESVAPELVTRDAKGEVETVRYEAVNAMLLNEFLKQHRKVEEQEATMTQLKATVAKQEATITQQQKDFQSAIAKQQRDFEPSIAQQQEEIKTLTASLKAQASLIQKVSDQIQLSKAPPQLVISGNKGAKLQW